MKINLKNYKNDRKKEKVKDLDSAKTYVDNVLKNWCAFCLAHREFIKALEIIMGVDNEKEND